MLLGLSLALSGGIVAAPAAASPRSPVERSAGASVLREEDRTGVGIQLIDIPADKVEDSRARTYIVDHVKPGGTITRRVEISNTTGAPQKVELYAGAASIEGNAFTVADGRTASELTGWVTLEQSSVLLEPDEKRRVRINVAVPSTASKGERYGAVWAQIASLPGDGNVEQIHRVGIRMYLDIGPGGDPPTDFRIDGVTVGPGPGEWPVVTANVTNTGERTLDMTGTLSMSKASVKAGPFKVVNSPSILAGQTGQVQVEINQALPDGIWDVNLSLTSGLTERTIDSKITLPVVKPVPVEPSGTPRWLVIAASAGAALVLLAVALVWWIARRRGST